MRVPFVAAAADPEPRPAVSDRAAGVALPAVDRLLDVVQPRRARLRVAQPREPAVQHLPDGAALDRARQRATTGRRPAVRGATRVGASRRRGAGGAGRRAAVERARRRCGRRCASPSCAIRAATSSRPTSPTSRPRSSSSTRCAKSNVTVHRATRGVHGRRQELSGGLVRRDDRPGVPSARDGHVRAAGSSRTSFRIRARRRRRPTTTPAGRWRSRWACSSIASSSRSPGRSRR